MAVQYEDIEECDDFMTLKEWYQDVQDGTYTDDDGYGYIATRHKKTDIKVYPSSYEPYGEGIPVWATHIVWVNK